MDQFGTNGQSPMNTDIRIGGQTTMLGRLVMALSGGLVKTQGQATAVMISIIVICGLVILGSFILGSGQGAPTDNTKYIPGTPLVDDSAIPGLQ